MSKLPKIPYPKIFVHVCITCMATSALHGGEPIGNVPAVSPPESQESWDLKLALYGWAADTSAVTATGQSAELPFSDALSDLEMAFMARAAVRRDRWELGADIIYQDIAMSVGGGNIDLTSYIITPTIGYDVLRSERATINVFAGARYLEQSVEGQIVNGMDKIPVSNTDRYWSAILGVKGEYDINECYFLSWYADIGTGEPDLNWQLFVGLGYRFAHFDFILGYRHLEWHFESGETLSELTTSGPVIAIRFEF